MLISFLLIFKLVYKVIGLTMTFQHTSVIILCSNLSTYATAHAIAPAPVPANLWLVPSTVF